MRNLRNTRFEEGRPPVQFNGRPVTAATWDLANSDDSIVCTIGPTPENPLIELVRVQTKKSEYEFTAITSWDAPCPNPELDCDEILNLHYFGDSLTACLVLAGGDIVVVREEPMSGEDRIEIVGSIDEGITAAKWSPDEELLAITTKVNTVVFMSRGFEGITDVTMTAEDLKASNHVSVGWGKKETQFHGRGAKALRDPTMPEKTDEGVLSSNDDSRATITWRGDGAYLAISTIEGGVRRMIRVYSREGVLDSVSEPVDGLESALSWRPAGNLIAGIQRLNDRIDIVFFERNGLRHGEFSLRLTPEQLHTPDQHIRLAWNSDSTVLAVILSDSTQLWTMGNYHWYLKQEIRVKLLLPNCPLVWHPERTLKLVTISSDSVHLIEYIFYTAKGSTSPPNDSGVVAVLDGLVVKLTPFKTANVPPPMALHEFEVSSNAIDIALNSDASLIAVLHREGISLFQWRSVSASSSAPTLTGKVTFEKADSQIGNYQQITFGVKDQILALQREDHGEHIIRFGFDDDTGRLKEMDSKKAPVSEIASISSFSQNGSSHPFAQGRTGDLHSLVFGETTLAYCSSNTYLPWVEVIPSKEDHISFGMTSNGHLYANSRLLVKNCTSFLVTPAHLIITTTTHLLKFIHITGVQDLEVPPDDPEKDERCRSVERGSRLVTAMPLSLGLVLQMPRGNLETIYPRAMVLAGIRKLIDEKDYRKAFTHCRTQRVDMNILYDHNPAQFLSNVPLFVDQVKKVTYIDLFLSSLRDEDVTQVMYKETRIPSTPQNGIHNLNGLEAPPVESGLVKASKVNKICDAVLEVLQTRQSTNLQNIITANVSKSPPALDDGLQVVAQLMKDDPTLADKAVEHICFLADVNKLYENALGLYNLELTLLVAQRSQKDPREYLPFMQKLQEMSELRRQFSIDDFLARHSKALTHLHTLDAFEELQIYTQKHNLYQSALEIYRYNPSRHASLTSLYASYLESISSFKEAALAYESLQDYVKATSCYLASGPSQWRETLFSALSQDPPLPQSALTNLATALYDGLTESKDHLSAGTIQLDYLSSVPNAVRSFCKGYFFAEAFHLIALKNQRELLESVIDPGLGEAFASSTELLADCKAQLLAQVPRIRELRLKALLDPLAFYEGERGGGGDGDIPDDVSIAASSRLSTSRSLYTRYTGKNGSVGTAGTGVSRATSKNRKREERKRARGKKGSVYEEEYLVNSVERLISRVESVRGEVSRLVLGLVRRGMWERARALESAVAEVVGMCKACLGEVFGQVESEQKAIGEGEEEGPRAVGAEAVLQEAMEANGRKREVPLVSDFEKLTLLGS